MVLAMSIFEQVSRRTFLKGVAAAPLSTLALISGRQAEAADKHIPVGLELYSVRDDLKKDPMGTLQRVAAMGYECVEFYAPYFEWTPEYAKQVRKQLDDLKIRCYSTHNGMPSFTGDGVQKAIELNKILDTRYIVLAHPGNVSGVDGWKALARTLDEADDKMKHHGLHAGYHNHGSEWKPVDGQKPMEILAANTDKSVMLQLDVGTCVESGNDPVAWIDDHPGRTRSLHLKDWSSEKGYKALFGESDIQWKKIFAAAESKGGVEFYLVEQEGSDFPELETADRCLVAFRSIHG